MYVCYPRCVGVDICKYVFVCSFFSDNNFLFVYIWVFVLIHFHYDYYLSCSMYDHENWQQLIGIVIVESVAKSVNRALYIISSWLMQTRFNQSIKSVTYRETTN